MNNFKTGQRFRSSGGQIAYNIAGQGPPLVLVHGAPFWSYIWRNIAPELARRWTVYMYDLLGYGSSEMYEGQDVSLAAQARILGELLDHWELTSPGIVGHDFGAAVVLRTHLIEGRPFSRMVLLDAVALAPWSSPFIQHVKKYGDSLRGLPGYIHEAMIAAYVRDAICRQMSDQEIAPYVQPWLGPVGQEAFYRQIDQMEERYTDEVAPHYSRIQCPVLLLWGEHDRWIPPAQGEQLQQMIPNSEFQLIPNAAHLLQEDAPRAVASHLAEFFLAVTGVQAQPVLLK